MLMLWLELRDLCGLSSFTGLMSGQIWKKSENLRSLPPWPEESLYW